MARRKKYSQRVLELLSGEISISLGRQNKRQKLAGARRGIFRAPVAFFSIYTVVSRLPIEADGRPRYRIKSKTENIERVVTEEQISRLV